MAPKSCATKKPCVNNVKYMHTGDEKSPLGLGYAPDGDLPKLCMKGKDGNMWMVSVKNGVKVWVKVPDEVADLEKDVPILDCNEQPKKEEEPAEEPPKPAKKVATKKKAAPAPPKEEEEPPKPKKTATKKAAADEGAKRPLTDYQKFMKIRRDELVAAGEKFVLTAVAAEWKALTPEKKSEILAKINA